MNQTLLRNHEKVEINENIQNNQMIQAIQNLFQNNNKIFVIPEK